MQAFSAFGSVSEARVMWDMKTGRSRGYGFVAFRDRPEAEKALSSMDGEWLGSRAIRCNWANQKGQPSIAQQQAMQAMGMTPTTPYGHHHFPTHGVHSYDMIVSQTPAWQTTCYVGNLTPYTTQNDLVPLFTNFGYVVESRFQADRGFAFIKMDTHENAAMAICQLNGYNVNGRPLKCSVSILPDYLGGDYEDETNLLLISGARTRLPTLKRSTPTRLIAPRALRPPASLARRTSTSLSIVASESVLKQSGLDVTNPMQRLSTANRATTAVLLHSLPRATGPRWVSAVHPVLVAMAEASSLPMPNGLRLSLQALATAVTRVNFQRFLSHLPKVWFL